MKLRDLLKITNAKQYKITSISDGTTHIFESGEFWNFAEEFTFLMDKEVYSCEPIISEYCKSNRIEDIKNAVQLHIII